MRERRQERREAAARTARARERQCGSVCVFARAEKRARGRKRGRIEVERRASERERQKERVGAPWQEKAVENV